MTMSLDLTFMLLIPAQSLPQIAQLLLQLHLPLPFQLQALLGHHQQARLLFPQQVPLLLPPQVQLLFQLPLLQAAHPLSQLQVQLLYLPPAQPPPLQAARLLFHQLNHLVCQQMSLLLLQQAAPLGFRLQAPLALRVQAQLQPQHSLIMLTRNLQQSIQQVLQRAHLGALLVPIQSKLLLTRSVLLAPLIGCSALPTMTH
mmetsp:Transcript_29916/g.69715  ORF Transcript_29916/g.69715 Transcript_29916/m.69715 type:complete len:200 (+) Transcript_29916:1253-1852(+)